MELFQYCKMQLFFLLLLAFVGYLYVKTGNRLIKKMHKRRCNSFYDILFVLGELALLFDGITACTVNRLDTVPAGVNMGLHLVYLLLYQFFTFVHFMYWLSVTDMLPHSTWGRLICYGPITLTALTTVVSIRRIYYYEGTITNYAKGIPAYACFLAIGLYELLILTVVVARKNYIQKNKRTAYIAANVAVCVVTLTQMIFNETLVAGFAVVLVISSIYLCLENPTIKYLELYHEEMVMGFSTLVESKDGSTGGHIRRSSAYADLIAQQLRKLPKYRTYITKDYLDNLQKAAPMHDIGKIGIPDRILQKPGKLTDEEYALMKKHPEIGGRIIKETFGHLDDDDYENMAYKVAMWHHEKWNGKGYPHQLSGNSIPLCARIMAVADVFDAVSAKRCYRDALPLDTCYRIIREGRGTDFDPEVVDAFFAAQKEVEKIYHTMQE